MIILDTAAAARHYGVTDRTVRRWVTLGRLMNRGTARRIRVELVDLEAMSARVCSSGDVSPPPRP